MRKSVLAVALALALGPSLACEEPEVPVGPPRCEPEQEHEIDRRLKLAFKALAMGDEDRARSLFQAVLGDAPGHPEAQLGLRLLQGNAGTSPLEPPAKQEPPPQPSRDKPPDGSEGKRRGSIQVAGEWIPVPFAVDASRWRFEELREQAPLRKHRDGAGPTHTYYKERVVGGSAIAPTDPIALADVVDLVVLHDTHTRTAREAVIELEGGGGSTHFIVDWDGAIYQLLDLAWEANHSQRANIDARSVSIDLVNPVELGDKPGLPDEAEARGQHRPLSDFVRLQGEEVQQWGYTDAQLTSLESLVRAIAAVLPRVPLQVPSDGSGIRRAMVDAPDDARGVIGHLHVSRRALDPGAGFPWEAFDKALRTP